MRSTLNIPEVDPVDHLFHIVLDSVSLLSMLVDVFFAFFVFESIFLTPNRMADNAAKPIIIYVIIIPILIRLSILFMFYK